MSSKGKGLWILPYLLLTVLLIACNQGSATPTSGVQITATVATAMPQPTSAESDAESTQHPPVAPTVPAAVTAPAEQATSPAAPAGEKGPHPDLLARMTLAPTGAQIHDLLLDSAAGRLYVTDTSGQLHVLDAATYQEVATLPASGDLVLDPERQRLYASIKSDEGDLTIVDTETLSVVGIISPGGSVALDSGRGRLYLGNPAHGPQESGVPGTRVYDAGTLIKVGEVQQPGIPVYNPTRDELYIVAYTVHVADPETLQLAGDLLPEITEQSLPWCNGCLAATNAHIYPDRNLLVVDVTFLSAGKGPGTEPPPRFFDAATLKEITDLAVVPPVERGCRDRPILAGSVESRVYRGDSYSRYVSHNNLLIYDQQGVLEDWRDGLSLGITNPQTGHMYVPHGDDTLVLDLSQLAPVGALPPFCIHTLDTGEGRIYALAGRDLLVLSDQGGWLEPPPTGQPVPLPEDPLLTGHVRSILPSPDYARDQTLFMTTSNGRLYRSTDGGQTWAHLQGGLPQGDYLNLDLTISPDFATDRTLFVGGFRGEFWGEGVYRSTDGGDTWQSMWKDLTHLRVFDVALSPNFSVDGTLLAYSNYQRIRPWRSGASTFRSIDRGMSWTLVMTSTVATDLPRPEDLLPAARTQPAVQFRAKDYGQGVDRTMDGAKTWEPMVISGQPNLYTQAVQTSPSFAIDHTVYVLTEYHLFRSTDGGQTWEQWKDERLNGRDYTNKLATITTSPILPDGRHQLFVGTYGGEFWALHPEELTWEPVRIAAQWPTMLKGEWVGAIETTPNDEVWLGTWGGGLAHQSAGTIQARHTITEGLPTQFISAVAADPKGTLWAGGDLPPGIASWDGDTWIDRPLPDEDAVGGVQDITVAPDGTIWAAGRLPGLMRWIGQEWEIVPDPEGLTGWHINEIEIDDAGIIWAATARGLVYYSEQGWSGNGGLEATAVELGPMDAAYLLLSDASVWRRADGQWSELPSLQEGQVLRPMALYADLDGAVWVGTQAGIFRYNGSSWRQFTVQDGLPSNQVATINQDSDGWLWFGTSNGAARVNPETLELDPVVWSALPTPAPRLVPAPTQQVQPTPTPCSIPAADPFAQAYMEAQVASTLQCPTADPTSTAAAYQPFEYGLMFWRADKQEVYVLEADGSWAGHPDTWDSSQLPADPALQPPGGLLQPVRGFGKVWRERLGGPEADIGWALVEEQGYELVAQPFAGGQIFLGPWDEVYVLYTNGTWQSIE